MKNIDLFKEIGISVNKTGKNQQKLDCPRCSVTNSLSVNKGLGLYNCYSCGFKGKVKKQ